jgi:hypothetical protein
MIQCRQATLPRLFRSVIFLDVFEACVKTWQILCRLVVCITDPNLLIARTYKCLPFYVSWACKLAGPVHLQMHNTHTSLMHILCTYYLTPILSLIDLDLEETWHLPVSAISETHELGRMLAWTKMGRWTPNNFAVRCVKVAMCHGFMMV